MENLNEILKMYSIKNVVLDKSININFDKLNVSRFDDVRSAAFYAFGQSKITNESVALVIDGNFLSNIYTVLTEAWFQKANLLVIAIYDSIYDIETNYLNRCLVFNVKLFNEDYLKFKKRIEDSKKIIGPKLINIVNEKLLSADEVSYDKIIDLLENYLTKDDLVYVYNATLITSKELRINNIDRKYKYGVISKYVAANLYETKKSILICTSDCIKVDSNIFNNRYINEKFKLIILKTDELNINDWITSNNIKYFESNNLNVDIKELCNANEPIVLVVKEDV